MGHPKNHDKQKSAQDERARRMGELSAAPLLSMPDVALYLDVPLSTLHKLRAQGAGPRTLKIGGRVYATQPEIRAWIDHMAKVSAGH